MKTSPREVWVKRVEQWKDSGLSAKDFAAQTGLSFSALKNWRYRLAAQARRAQGAGRGLSPIGFVEFAAPGLVPKAPRARRRSGAGASEPLELVVREGFHLRIPRGFDVDTLRQVLSAVTEA